MEEVGRKYKLVLFYICILILFGCNPPHKEITSLAESDNSTNSIEDYNQSVEYGKGALLLTRFSSLEDFKSVVQVRYSDDLVNSSSARPQVHLIYRSGGYEVSSELKEGISQGDFIKVRNSSYWKKIGLGITCPYALLHKKELTAIEHLGRRRPPLFGKGDAAFYDLAETMVKNIREEDRLDMSCEELSEKGYLNTFNHITAQAFMTSMFSERLADFVADVHELYTMPELINGKFTETQLADFVNGPVDNYVDMINNEWGQELGKVLRKKYSISSGTYWTPELLANVLNDIQRYYSWAFQVGFIPFKTEDEMVKQFAWKINTVLGMS